MVGRLRVGNGLLAAILVLALGLLSVHQPGPGRVSASAIVAGGLRVPPTSESVSTQAAPAAPAPAAPPVRLSIPAAGVEAPIEPVGVDTDGRMATPSGPDKVGWYSLGTLPGDAGSAVLDGHLDWWTGQAVFWQLNRLHNGDVVTVTRADSSLVRFVVASSALYPYDASPEGVFSNSGAPSLALITCAGTWDRQRQTYQQRLIVRAVYAPLPAAQPPPEPN